MFLCLCLQPLDNFSKQLKKKGEPFTHIVVLDFATGAACCCTVPPHSQ